MRCGGEARVGSLGDDVTHKLKLVVFWITKIAFVTYKMHINVNFLLKFCQNTTLFRMLTYLSMRNSVVF